MYNKSRFMFCLKWKIKLIKESYSLNMPATFDIQRKKFSEWNDIWFCCIIPHSTEERGEVLSLFQCATVISKQ